MTAIDIAVQSKALGAEEVTMVYRRGQEHMNASRYEQEFAQTRGVSLRTLVEAAQAARERPDACAASNSRLRAQDGGSSKERTATCSRPTWCSRPSGRRCCGIALADTAQILELKQDRIVVDDERRTSLPGVWAGGDCVFGGEDLTVSAVQDGKLAAISIDQFSEGQGSEDVTWPI